MVNLTNRKLLFLFSKGMSVEKWDKLGILPREIDIYSRLAEVFNQVWWYSYGESDSSNADVLSRSNLQLFQVDKQLLRSSISYDEYDAKVLHKYPGFFQQFDVIKTNQFSSACFGLKIKEKSGAQLVVRRGAYYPLTWRLANKRPWVGLREYYDEKRVYAAADAVILPTLMAKNYVVARHGINLSKIFVIPNAINTEFFNGRGRIYKGNRLLFIGRLTFQKNVKALFEAIKTLDCSLSIIGEGRYRAFLEKFVKRYTLEVTFLEKRPYFRLPEIYSKHDIFVLPSRYEGSPKVLLEAMACKMAAVGANSWGIRDVLRDDYNGILCGTKSWQIRKGIQRCLNKPDKIKSLGENARKTIEENNEINKLLEKEIRIYEGLIG